MYFCVCPSTHIKNPQEKKNKFVSNFVTMPGFELHVGVDAEHLKDFQKISNTGIFPYKRSQHMD